MKTLALFAFLLSAGGVCACESALLDQQFRRLASSEEINLCDAYAGKVLLVVNTASKCGFTPQYDGLEALYKQYGDDGLVVLGFPSNDFLGQEPGSEEQIAEFCRLTYGVEFPMFEKTTVKGDGAHPFFVALADASGTFPTWNFHKFLIGRDGKLVAQYGPRTLPNDEALVAALQAALGD